MGRRWCDTLVVSTQPIIVKIDLLEVEVEWKGNLISNLERSQNFSSLILSI